MTAEERKEFRQSQKTEDHKAKVSQAKTLAEKAALEIGSSASNFGFKTKGQRYIEAKITKMGRKGKTELVVENKDLFDVTTITIAAYLFIEDCPCTVLTLKRNKFSLAGFMTLLHVFESNKTVHTFNYISNVIGEELPVDNRDIYDYFEVFSNFMLRGADGSVRFRDLLKMNKSLVNINLEDNNLTDTGCVYISESLEENSTIKSLRLASNYIGDIGVKRLCEALLKNNAIESLDLDSNRFTITGANLLFETVNHVGNLKELHLRANDLTPNVTPAVAKTLETSSLQVLNLRRNLLGDTGVSRIAAALVKPGCKLKKLLLSSNRIGNLGCTNLADALVRNSTLERLDIDMNCIEDEGAMSMAELFKTNRILKYVDMSMNEIMGPGCSAMADALKDNSTLLELKLSKSQVVAKEATMEIHVKMRKNKMNAGIETTRSGREAQPEQPVGGSGAPGQQADGEKIATPRFGEQQQVKSN